MTLNRRLFVLLGMMTFCAGGACSPKEPAAQENGKESEKGKGGGEHGKGGGGGKGGAGDQPVPVLASTVERRDVPIYLEGLGSVVAFKTVSVMSQVDGRLMNVAFTEGQEVKQGDLLAQIDPRPFQIQLRQGQAQLAKDRAALKDNRLNLDRYITLVKSNLMQQQMVDDQQALVDQGEAQVMADEAQIDNAKLNLDYARITSPIDGKTGVRLVDQGNLIHAAAATPLVIITQLDPIAVLFTLPEDVLPQVFAQMNLGPLTAQAQSRDGATELGTGKVGLVDNQINQATGTIRLKAVFDNPKRMLWPNQFVKMRLLLQTRKNVIVVPAAAVQHGPSGAFAYLVTAEKTAEMRPVTLDATEGNLAIISDGLKEGETAVTDGQYQLRPGARVTIRTPGGAGHQKAGGKE
jgi:multidrug efflux system membrane fusion protein